ncbi:MAG: hypothetical protein JWN40_2217 [Phycisphaerales bacterium]|nr:hypothetical protein [Phycisphaerales bacterium]
MNRTGNLLGNSTEGERAVRKFTQRLGILAAAAAFVGVGTSAHAQTDLLYDWKKIDNSTPVPTVTGYIPAPFVSTGNVSAAALSTLTANQATFPGKVAVKIVGTTPLSAADNTALFGASAPQINYAFMDYEGVNGQATATQQAAAIRAQPKPATFIGNFRMYPGNGDTSGVGSGPTVAQYTASGMNMANEDLYPGSPLYKNPGGVGGTSTSPNIRSSLFVLPIDRATFVTSNLPAGNKHIPYVNRFNNSGNSALDSDGNAANGYQFNNPTGQQMLSRGDFSAMVAHYRARGVDGVHLLDGGVVGYTQSQFEQDAKDGFTFAPFANIFAGSNPKLAALDTVSKVNGVVASNESTGVVFSGVYSLTQNDSRLAGSTGKLALLLSNLSATPATLEFVSKIGGKTVTGAPYSINAGEHKLLEFAGTGLQWSLVNTAIVFTDADRSGVGVPEPVAMGGASIFALTMLFRRRRSR